MIDPLHRLKKLCAEQAADLKNHLVGGGAVDYSAYSKAVGAVQALEMVLSEIEEIERLLSEEQ